VNALTNKLLPSLFHKSRPTTSPKWAEGVRYVNTTLLTPTVAQWYVVFLYCCLHAYTTMETSRHPKVCCQFYCFCFCCYFISSVLFSLMERTPVQYPSSFEHFLINRRFSWSVCLWIVDCCSLILTISSHYFFDIYFQPVFKNIFSRVFLLYLVIFWFCPTDGFTTQ